MSIIVKSSFRLKKRKRHRHSKEDKEKSKKVKVDKLKIDEKIKKYNYLNSFIVMNMNQ